MNLMILAKLAPAHIVAQEHKFHHMVAKGHKFHFKFLIRNGSQKRSLKGFFKHT